MIHNIIFDVAQVLVAYNIRDFALGQGGDPGRMSQAVEIVARYPNWSKVDMGVVSEEEMIYTIIQENPNYAQELEVFLGQWYNAFIPMEGMEKLLVQLQAAGYALYYLSNFPQQAFDYIYKKFSIFQIVAQGVVSYQVQMVKPDPAIYYALLNKFDLRAEESIFIDDREENTAAAETLGFFAHTFTTVLRFEEYLSHLGLVF